MLWTLIVFVFRLATGLAISFSKKIPFTLESFVLVTGGDANANGNGNVMTNLAVINVEPHP